MGVLTGLISAVQRDAQYELDGKTVTRATLAVTDGVTTTYCCNVDIGVVTPQGYDQTQNLLGTNINGTVLYNVPIARGNQDVIYAEVGSPVRLRRSPSGRYEIVGFSKTMPGTNIRVPVDLTDFTLGPIEDKSIVSRPLTLAELADYPSFGATPLGAIAIYEGSTLIGIES